MSRVSRLLNQRVEIWRAVRVSDGGGGWRTTFVHQLDTRARFSQPSALGREQVVAEQGHAEWVAHVYFEPGTDIQRNDEIRRTGKQKLIVEAVIEPSESGTYLRANCSAEQVGA